MPSYEGADYVRMEGKGAYMAGTTLSLTKCALISGIYYGILNVRAVKVLSNKT